MVTVFSLAIRLESTVVSTVRVNTSEASVMTAQPEAYEKLVPELSEWIE